MATVRFVTWGTGIAGISISSTPFLNTATAFGLHVLRDDARSSTEPMALTALPGSDQDQTKVYPTAR